MKLFEAFPRSLLYLVLLSVATTDHLYGVKQKRTSKFVFKDGDLIIGGLSPVHFSPLDMEGQAPDEFTCQGELNTRGFEAVEAMLFTMDMLNEGALKDKVLPNITIGMDIKETCTSADNAVRESLNFSFIQNANMQSKCTAHDSRKIRKTKTVAVVGAAYSGVSMAVTNLCGLFYVPLVSYASTSRLLSNKVQFRYFFRTVPSDMLQAQVMADLVRSMNWNYVITLASDTEYGRSGIEAFKQAAQSFEDYNICIPIDETFTKRSDQETFKKIFQRMRETPKAKVVILFAELQDAKILIDAIREQGINEKYVWIGSDAWAESKQVLKGNEDVLNGMFAIQPAVRKNREFIEYFVNFNDKRRQRNPWMSEYEDEKVAYDPAFHRQTFLHYPKAPYVMDAVLATAYALHNLLGCKPYKDCSSKKSKINSPQFQKTFVDYLKKVRFPGLSRDVMYFDESGDAIGIYDIRHLKLVGENYDFFKVGRWGSGNCGLNTLSNCLKLRKNEIDQSLMNSTWDGTISFSRCSPTCSAGYHKVSEIDHAKCCWTCRKCSGRTISNATDRDACLKCPKGFWANSVHSECEPIKPTVLHWLDPAGLVICVSMGLGGVAVTFAFIVFIFYRETPVVKASSRELCYVLLLGIGWCFVVPVFYLLEPTDVICRVIPFATGLCPSLVVGTLLTKTNRISRIFNRKLSKAGAPNCLSKKWQLLMVACITIVEIVFCTICTYISTTGRNVVTFETKKELIIECRSLPDIWVAIRWAYIAGLVVTCTYQAFLTRKLPENYNESKFISFAMLTTCIVVIMYIPTYNGTSGIYRTVVTCFVFIIGGSTAYGCMFVPKLYIILWRPEKNVPMQPRTQSAICLGTITPLSKVIRRESIDQNSIPDTETSSRERFSSMPFASVEKSQTIEFEELRRYAGNRLWSFNVDIFRNSSDDFSDIDETDSIMRVKGGKIVRQSNTKTLYYSKVVDKTEGCNRNKSCCELVGKEATDSSGYIHLVNSSRCPDDYLEFPASELEDLQKMIKRDTKIIENKPNYSDRDLDYMLPKNREGDRHTKSKPSCSSSSYLMRKSTTCTSKTDSYFKFICKPSDHFGSQNDKNGNGCMCYKDMPFKMKKANSEQGPIKDGKMQICEKHVGSKEFDSLQHQTKQDKKNTCRRGQAKEADYDQNLNVNNNRRRSSEGQITIERFGRDDLHTNGLSKSLSYPANELLGTYKIHSNKHNCKNNGHFGIHILNALSNSE